jgi:hypothetical protein
MVSVLTSSAHLTLNNTHSLSGETTNTNFIVFGLPRSGLEPTIYTIEASTLIVNGYSV